MQRRWRLQLEYPNPTYIKRDIREVITAEKLWEAAHEQNWQEKLISARSEDESLNFGGCFRWLSRLKPDCGSSQRI